MKRFDCDVCLSAGSVNQWGFCEICGEDFEDPGSRVIWRDDFQASLTMESAGFEEVLSSVGRDAA